MQDVIDGFVFLARHDGLGPAMSEQDTRRSGSRAARTASSVMAVEQEVGGSSSTELYHYRHMFQRSNGQAGFSPAGREILFAIMAPFTQNLPTESCGEGRVGNVRFAFREVACGLGSGDGVVGVDHSGERMGLYGRATTGLHERRVPPLQRRDPEYRPHHRLHGATQIAAVASLPGSVHVSARACSLRRRT